MWAKEMYGKFVIQLKLECTFCYECNPRYRFGHVFMAETGTSVGEISGQSKSINSCDFRPARPFRIVTGSEDNTIGVFEGPPFKFKMTKQVYGTSLLTTNPWVVCYSTSVDKLT